MASRPISAVVQHLRRAALLQEEAALTDGQLLESFLTGRDEAAFEVLVRRYGPMVLGVCRRVLRNPHDADDAFQATFLVLVRRAGSVVPRERVGNFLYGVAYQTALKARTAASKRRAREKSLLDLPEPATSHSSPRSDWQALLDQELHQLPDKYRIPLLLCDVEGQTRKEAARQLGWPEGTLSGRLARARSMLARRLARRGLALPGGAVALSTGSASASAPADLVLATVKAGTLLAAGRPAADVIPAQILALSESVVEAMLLTKLKITGVLLLLVGILGFGASALHQALATESSHAAAQSRQFPGRDAGKAKEPAPKQPAPQEKEAKIWTLDFHFKDPRLVKVTDRGMGNKTILYLKYEVVNTTPEPRTFIPNFEFQADDKPGVLDQVFPQAMKQIAQIEDPTNLLDLKNSVTIASQAIRQRASGLATWDGVDLNCQRCSIFVNGLSNAWTVAEGDPPAKEPVVRRKTLRLNFKRQDGNLVFVPPAQWVYRPARVRQPVPKDKPGTNPPEKPDDPKDILKDVKARQEIADRQAAALVEQAIGQANQLLQKNPGGAVEFLKRTLESVRNNPDLSDRTRTSLGERLEAALKDVDRKRAQHALQKGEKGIGQHLDESAERQVRQAVIEALEEELAPLLKQETDRQITLEITTLQWEALRKAVEETKPTGIEADRASERLRRFEILVDNLKTENRDKQIYFQLLIKRLQALRKGTGEEHVAKPPQGSPTEQQQRQAEIKRAEGTIAKLTQQSKNWQKEREQLQGMIRGWTRIIEEESPDDNPDKRKERRAILKALQQQLDSGDREEVNRQVELELLNKRLKNLRQAEGS